MCAVVVDLAVDPPHAPTRPQHLLKVLQNRTSLTSQHSDEHCLGAASQLPRSTFLMDERSSPTASTAALGAQVRVHGFLHS